MADTQIVSIGFLTQNDLNRLGKTFTHHVPLVDDDLFAGLIAQLDTIEAIPHGDGITIMPHKIR